MKELIELSVDEWKEFKLKWKSREFYALLDFAIVKDLGDVLIMDKIRLDFIIMGGQVSKNMIRY